MQILLQVPRSRSRDLDAKVKVLISRPLTLSILKGLDNNTEIHSFLFYTGQTKLTSEWSHIVTAILATHCHVKLVFWCVLSGVSRL